MKAAVWPGARVTDDGETWTDVTVGCEGAGPFGFRLRMRIVAAANHSLPVHARTW